MSEFLPELILLAKIDSVIQGFIIIRKSYSYDGWHDKLDTAYCSWLAVDPECERQGIGTDLLLQAMSKVKERGKKYFILTYKAWGMRVDKAKGNGVAAFYHRFSFKYGVPIVEDKLYDADKVKMCRLVYQLGQN